MARAIGLFCILAALPILSGFQSVAAGRKAHAFSLPGLRAPRSQNPSTAGEIPQPGPPEAADGAIGESCRSGDSNHVCLALKYVGYRDPSDNPTVTLEQAVRNVRDINQLWKQCNIGFQIESYFVVEPAKMGLKYAIADYGDLDQVREALGEAGTLLIVTTGTWDRKGSLGSSTANAWTSLPESGPYGAILEKPVATYSNIIAHELGHYLDLRHLEDSANLMSPVIYRRSKGIGEAECLTARRTARTRWRAMLR